MSEHTPGPWEGEHRLSGKFKITNGDRMARIAIVDNANDARLIAAAPDLLAALKHIICIPENDAEQLDEAIASARAAIAKAEGSE